MSTVELKITRGKSEKGEYAPTALEVNGTNIASAVTSYTLTHDVGGAVTCTVALIPGSVAAAIGAANVVVDDATAQALTALGYVGMDDVLAVLQSILERLEGITNETDGRLDFSGAQRVIDDALSDAMSGRTL